MLATRVSFLYPIVAVQSKLWTEAFSPDQSSPSASAVTGQTSCAVLTQRRIYSSWTLNSFSKCRSGQTTCTSLHPATDTTPPGRSTPSASAASGQTTCTSLHPVTDPAPPGRTTSTGCIPAGFNAFPFSNWWSRHRSSVMSRDSGILGADSFHSLWAWPAAIPSWRTRSTSTSEARVSNS